MSTILYYSNFCSNCKAILQEVSQSTIKDDIHFVCIDNRATKANGATYIILSNGQEILLPPSIVKVPALLLLNKGHQVLFGSDIKNFLAPKKIVLQKKATENNGEPMAFALGAGDFGVASDHFSYLDQDSTELSAKGDGGMRQQHHYASLEHCDDIQTPPDTYAPDTIGSVSMENIEQKRSTDIKMN